MKSASVYATPSKNQQEDEDNYLEQELTIVSKNSPKMSPKMSPKTTPPSSRALEDEFREPQVAKKKQSPKYTLPMTYAAGGDMNDNREKLKNLLRIFGVEIILNPEVCVLSLCFVSLHFSSVFLTSFPPFASCL